MKKMKLEELDCFISDGNYSSKYPRNDEFVENGIPFIRCNNFKNNSITNIDMYYITKEKHSILLKGHVKTGDILITTRGSLGQVVIVPEEYDDANINAQIVLLRVNKEKIYNKYLMYQLKSQNLQNQIQKNKTGTALQQLPVARLKKLEFNIEENIEKQKEISNTLEKIEKLIDVRKNQLENLELLVKSQFVEMFGNPILNEKQWVKKEIQELVMPDCTISYGIVQTGDEVDDGIPVFRPIDIVNNVPKLENLKKTAKEISDRYKKTILKGNELLITVRANIGDTYIIDESFKDCNVGRGITPLRFDEKYINTNFMKIQLDNDEMKYEIKKLAKGITLLQLNMEDLRKIRVIVPPIELQKDFVDKIKLIDKQKFEIQKSLEEMQKLQESLMNKYFG